MEFVLLPKGKSWLGGGGGRPGDKEVVIAHDFYLGKYEVTQEEWDKVTGKTPSIFSRTGRGKDMVKDIAEAELKRFPVENVSWDDAQAFLERLNKTGEEAGWQYRLPKEAEWEYACRGGPLSDKSDSAYDFHLDKPTNQLLPEQANFGGRNGLKRTCKVGSYKPNRLGLYDMHGNVWEWCDDGDKGADGASRRVHRGGCWRNDSGPCRAAGPGSGPPSRRFFTGGLRVARVPVGNEAVKIPSEEKKAAVAAQPPEARKGPVVQGTETPRLPPHSSSPDGFVPLFNGKNLTGWKTHPDQRGNWRVENGVLVGSGPDVTSHLYTERDDYKDFWLRVEARLNDGGNSGVYFRCPFGPALPAGNPRWLLGYNAKIDTRSPWSPLR